MDDPKTLDLVKELLQRFLTSSENPASPAPPPPPVDLARALKYAHRVLSSRMSPSISVDESAMAESIKRGLVHQGRSSDALAFADLYSKLVSRSSSTTSSTPPRNRWALLYLLKSLSEDRDKRTAAPSQTLVKATTSPFAGAASGGLPSLPLVDSSSSSYSGRGSVSKKNLGAGGVLMMSKDPENIREIALGEYANLARKETSVSESVLVRDVLYAAQGVDGRFVKFIAKIDGYDLPPDSGSFRVPRSTRMMVRKLCELGWLFRMVKGYISECIERSSADKVGTVGQALYAALQDELSEYYKLLAVLESQTSVPIPLASPGSGGASSGNYLSLSRLSVWFAEPIVRMRLMAVLVDGCRSFKGGAMAGAIHGCAHKYAQFGDRLEQEFMSRLLRRVCSPLFEMVRTWVLEGELEDVFGEFFIVGQPVKAESLWRDGYRIQTSMLPSFIPETLAQRILRTGKSINFLRVCCEDNGWAEAAMQAAAHVGTTTCRGGLGYGETNALEALVVEAAKRIDKHLMEVIHQRYRFKDHCLAIKQYLLLGQGDFVQYLMDIVGPELSEPANTISSFQLSGLLETAIRASNAQYDDRDILDRLHVKMMEYEEGDRGWDVFSLEYDACVPLDTVFTASVMKRYFKIFNFLWKLKRVEHALIKVWKTMKPNRIISCLFGSDGVAVKFQFVSVLRRCQVLWNEMNHFLRNFQDYIMFEVLEVSWACFLDEMDSAKDLDDLLAAHEKYLSSIVEKSLLGERSQVIFKTLFLLFDLILRFHSNAHRWFENIYDLQPRGKTISKLQKSKLKSNSGVSRKAVMQVAGEFLGKMEEDLNLISKEYSSSLKVFVSQLSLQQHVDLKFLLFRLDFTEYYSRFPPGR